jgi:hypothetical protein
MRLSYTALCIEERDAALAYQEAFRAFVGNDLRRGPDGLIIDDPVKDAQLARNQGWMLGYRASPANADLSGKRIDKHAVIVTLAPNYTAALAALFSQDVNTRLRRIENFTRLVPVQ